MTVFALRFDRPDKRAPFINWFTNAMHADRTAQSIMYLTAKDYGLPIRRSISPREREVRFLSPDFGWKANLERLIEACGEERLVVTIACFEEAPKGVIVHDRPRRIICWERARASEVAYFENTPRSMVKPVEKDRSLRTHHRRTGVELFNARRSVTS